MAAFDIRGAIDAAKNKGQDMTQSSGGGGFEAPAAGFTRMRFVGYYETGKKESMWQGKKKINSRAELVFELSGPKHQPRDTDNGKVPLRITQSCNLSLNENSQFFGLFKAMNWENKAKHIAELLGQDFVGEIVHNKKTYNGKEVTFANIDNIRKPFVPDPETGEDRRIIVDAPLSPLKLFLWDFATPEMWDDLFIPGEYEERKNDKGEVTAPAKSKNVWQNKIREALNFKACPIFDYAQGKITAQDAADLDAAVGGVEESAPSPDDLDGIA